MNMTLRSGWGGLSEPLFRFSMRLWPRNVVLPQQLMSASGRPSSDIWYARFCVNVCTPVPGVVMSTAAPGTLLAMLGVTAKSSPALSRTKYGTPAVSPPGRAPPALDTKMTSKFASVFPADVSRFVEAFAVKTAAFSFPFVS